MLTHGHTDHTSGNGVYARAYPGLAIVAHRETRNLMARYTPGFAELFARRTAELKQQVASGKADDGTPLTTVQMAAVRDDVRAREAIDPDLRGMGDNPLPDLTFEQGSMAFDLGGREVQVKFLGRGNTAGDVVVWLPAERLAIVGDILVAPVPFTCSGFPVDWIGTLDAVAGLHPQAIVPGHGPVMRDLTYLHTVRELLVSVVDQVNAIFQRLPGEDRARSSTRARASASRRSGAGSPRAISTTATSWGERFRTASSATRTTSSPRADRAPGKAPEDGRPVADTDPDVPRTSGDAAPAQRADDRSPVGSGGVEPDHELVARDAHRPGQDEADVLRGERAHQALGHGSGRVVDRVRAEVSVVTAQGAAVVGRRGLPWRRDRRVTDPLHELRGEVAGAVVEEESKRVVAETGLDAAFAAPRAVLAAEQPPGSRECLREQDLGHGRFPSPARNAQRGAHAASTGEAWQDAHSPRRRVSE